MIRTTDLLVATVQRLWSSLCRWLGSPGQARGGLSRRGFVVGVLGVAGTVVLPILPVRSFDFRSLGLGGTSVVPLTRRIETRAFASAVLLIRVHRIELGHGGAVEVELRNVATKGKDRTVGPVVASVRLTENAPGLYVATVSDPGPALEGVVRLISGAGAKKTYARLSADLVLKEA